MGWIIFGTLATFWLIAGFFGARVYLIDTVSTRHRYDGDGPGFAWIMFFGGLPMLLMATWPADYNSWRKTFWLSPVPGGDVNNLWEYIFSSKTESVKESKYSDLTSAIFVVKKEQ